MKNKINVKIPGSNRDFLDKLLADRLVFRKGIDNKSVPDIVRTDDMFNFISTWNETYQSELIADLNKIIADKRIEKIVFFFPGFNVPYALAQIQANNLIDNYKQELNDDRLFEHILFVKLFWPSFAYKQGKFTENYSKFNNDINYRSMLYFNNARNRVYSIGYQARKVISSLNFSGELNIIGHSSGSDLISVTLIDPIEKIDLKRNGTPFNEALVKCYRNTALPKNRIKTFLNAPSIPGIITFGRNQMDRVEQRNYHWTIGFNNSDKVLQKLKGRKQAQRPSNWFGNTNLGGNVNDEVQNTIDAIMVSDPNIITNFRFVEFGQQKDMFGHDFFCYMNQSCFKSEFRKFVIE